MRPEDRKNILMAGLFVSILLGVTSISLFLISKESKIFSSKATIQTKVSNAQGLREGAAVHFKGIKIGSVSAIEISTLKDIVIYLNVEEEYLKWIRTDSSILFKTQGVLGDKYLEIVGGNDESESVADGATLITDENSQFDKFINQGEDILTVANRVLLKIDAIMGPVENSRIDNILSNLEKATKGADNFFTHVEGKKVATAVNSLSDSAKSFEGVMSRIEKGPGSAHSLIYDPTVHEDLKALLGGAQRSKVLQYFIRETMKNNKE